MWSSLLVQPAAPGQVVCTGNNKVSSQLEGDLKKPYKHHLPAPVTGQTPESLGFPPDSAGSL